MTKRVGKGRRVLDMAVAISPIRDADGTVTGASTIARDLTEVVREVQLRRVLQSRLQAQRLESLGQLAGGVAHDFSNLLASITASAALILGSLTNELNRRGPSGLDVLAAVPEDVGQITAVAKRAAALTRQPLAFSRRGVLQAQMLDPNRRCESCPTTPSPKPPSAKP